MGFPVPGEEELRSDLGPPVGAVFTTLGLPPAALPAAVAAYRRFYGETGMRQSQVYPGVPELLDALAARRLALATATAKLTPVARDILALHGLADRFDVILGTDEQHRTKTETLAHALRRLGAPDPARVVMVGDRHSDVAAGRACGTRTAGALWGYGSAAELAGAGADHLLTAPEELLGLLS